MRIAELLVYPVKSMRGCAVDALRLDALGAEADRRFVVVDATGRFVTQRSQPRLALIRPDAREDALVLERAGAAPLRLPWDAPPGDPLKVSFWKDEGWSAEDCGAEAAAWLGEALGIECRLVRAGAGFLRPMDKPGISRPEDRLAFVDSFPLTFLSRASLDDLNARLLARGAEAVPMDRFRPNVVLEGCAAHAEDALEAAAIGGLRFRRAKTCARCVVTTVDQETAETGREPLATLASYRRDPGRANAVVFGVGMIHESKSGLLRLGEEVVPVRRAA